MSKKYIYGIVGSIGVLVIMEDSMENGLESLTEWSEGERYLKILHSVSVENIGKHHTLDGLAIDIIKIVPINEGVGGKHLMGKSQDNFSDGTNEIDKKTRDRHQKKMGNITNFASYASGF